MASRNQDSLERTEGRQEESRTKEDSKDGITPQRRQDPGVLDLPLLQVLDDVDAVVGGDLDSVSECDAPRVS